jgi:hypothetical protein
MGKKFFWCWGQVKDFNNSSENGLQHEKKHPPPPPPPPGTVQSVHTLGHRKGSLNRSPILEAGMGAREPSRDRAWNIVALPMKPQY